MEHVYGAVSLIIALAIQGWLTRFSVTRFESWTQRGIHIGRFGLKKALITTNVLALLTGLIAVLLIGDGDPITRTLLVPYSVALVMWVGVFSALTDMFSLKVPIDLAVRGYWAVFPPAVIAIILAGDNWLFIAISVFAFWFWAMFLYFFFGAGFGQADVRMMILHAFGLAWWVGVDWVFYTFLAACILQICFHPLSSFIRVGKRRAVGQRYNPTPDTLPPSMSVYDDEEPVFPPLKKKRSYLPLVPALTFVYTVLIYVSLFMDRTGCSAYEGLFCS